MLHIQHLILIEFAVEVCILDINLVHLYTKVIDHHNDSICEHKFSHWHVYIVIVNAADLAKALSNKTGLIAYDIACRILLCLEDPL
jgi:hypothetical protein